MTGISRRTFMAGTAAAAAAVALPGCSSDEPGDPGGSFQSGHVVVVGAGLAGLTCALDLRERGWNVRVLEARERVGGRVHTIRQPFADGMHAEAGGESIDEDHEALLAMVERFGLQTEDRPPNKILDGVTSYKGTRRSTTDFVGLHGGKVGADYERYYSALEELGSEIDADHPERYEDAEALDRRSVADFVDELDLIPEARFLVDTDNRSEFNTEPDRLSLLFLAQQWSIGSDISDEGVEAMRIAGGNDRLPKAMAEELGDKVITGSPVTRIEQTRDAAGHRVVVVHTAKASYTAGWVVLACPLPTVRRITFAPRLPAALRTVVEEVDLGEAAKVVLQYGSRFWEDDDLSGFTVTDQPFGVGWSPTDSYESERGLLTAFLTGDAAIAAARQSDSERIASVRAQFDEVYPEGRELHDRPAATVAWANERYTGGGYGVWRPGQMVEGWPALRAGTGRIRFAGEHTEALAGYMESAVRSGHRVAKELGDPPGSR